MIRLGSYEDSGASTGTPIHFCPSHKIELESSSLCTIASRVYYTLDAIVQREVLSHCEVGYSPSLSLLRNRERESILLHYGL